MAKRDTGPARNNKTKGTKTKKTAKRLAIKKVMLEEKAKLRKYNKAKK